MLSKNKIIIFFSIISTVLIFSGLWAHDIANKNREHCTSLGYDEYGNFISEATTSFEISEDTTSLGITEVAVDGNGNVTSQNTQYYETAETHNEQKKLEYELYSKKARLYLALSTILISFGLISVIIDVFFMRKYGSLLTVEGAIILLYILIERVINTSFTSIAEMVILVILIFLLPYALHDIFRWISSKFTIEENFSHRFGTFLSKEFKKPHIYIIVSIIWMLICTTGIFISIYRIRFYAPYENIVNIIFMLAISILFFLLSLIPLTRYVKAVSHLELQIQRLSSGETPEAGGGIYEDTEEKLLDLKSQRDSAIDNAIKSERFKIDLITNVSHDLRTPLTSILGYGELLSSEEMSSEGKSMLEQLNKKTGYMSDLVDKLFELTKISSGVIEPKKDEIDLVKLIEQTIGLFEDKLNAGNLTIKRHYYSEKIILYSDGAMLHQVFANLLGNAIKYSPTNSRIHIRITEEEGKARIKMSNISSYEMDFSEEEIVQRFARGDKSRSTTGSGLGLAIAKTYTDSVGGEFNIEIDDEQFVAIVKLPMN